MVSGWCPFFLSGNTFFVCLMYKHNNLCVFMSKKIEIKDPKRIKGTKQFKNLGSYGITA